MKLNLFNRAINLLCIGFVLIIFNINIERIELALYTTWAGSIFITLGLWMIRDENSKLNIAFRFSLLLLAVSSAMYWLGVFPDNNAVFGVYLLILSNIMFAVHMYYLFSGLRIIALRCENEQLANRLMRCFYLYVILFVLILLCMIIHILIIPTLIYGIVVLINIPLSVSKLKYCSPPDEEIIACKPILKTVWLCMLFYITVSIGGMIGLLYFVNTPMPEVTRFVNIISPETDEARESLLYFGMPYHILRDLPDDEVILFNGIFDASAIRMKSQSIVDRNGGTLEINKFIGFMPHGRVRTLLHYRWISLPSSSYVDLISIANPLRHFAILPDSEERGMALFDRNGVTYKQTLLNEGAIIGFPQFTSQFFMFPAEPGFIAQIKFRLFPNYENQRGYVAVSTQLTHPEVSMFFNVWTTYVHQERWWNRPHFSALNKTSPSGYSSIRNHAGARAFWSEMFASHLTFHPIK